MTSKEDFFKFLKQEVKERFNTNLKEITEKDDIELDFQFDSLDRIELLIDIEQHYKVDIPPVEANKARTVGDLLLLINKYKK